MSKAPLNRMAVLCALLSMGTGCRLTDRPYDVPFVCGTADGLHSNIEDAIAVVDRNNDGRLTEADARPGETIVIVELTGVHQSTGTSSPEGYTVHSDWNASMVKAPEVPQEPPEWGVEPFLDCFPSTKLLAWFTPAWFVPGDGSMSQARPDVGVYLPTGLAFQDLTTNTVGDVSEVSGDVRISGVDDGLASGHLNGTYSTVFVNMIPDDFFTGQGLTVHAMAFHDILIED